MQPITLTLTLDEVNQLLQALGEFPLKNTIKLFSAISSQAQAQIAEQEQKKQPA